MGSKAQQVEKIITTIDGQSFVSYRVVQEIDGVKVASEAYDDEVLVLKKLFKDQGELYEQIFGVSREDARRAGWHPDDSDFSMMCPGWIKFLKDKGKVEKQVQVETISVEEFVHSVIRLSLRDLIRPVSFRVRVLPCMMSGRVIDRNDIWMAEKGNDVSTLVSDM